MVTQPDRPSVCFIGLGVMGFPMAGHLANKGFPVTVYNRTPGKSQYWQTLYKGQATSNLNEAADSQIIISCIGRDEDLESVYLGSTGLLRQLQPGALVIDHTTASATMAERLFKEAAAQQTGFIDAPVSGGQQGAINGVLTVMCGGAIADFERAAPVISSYAKSIKLMGPAGAGQKTKMVNQIAIAGLVQGLAEAIAFSERSGLSTLDVIDVISRGAAQSWQMENRHKTMLEGFYEHGFAVDLMRKDLSIVFEEARKNGASLPVTALVDQFYSEVQSMGGGRWDTSSLLARLQRSTTLPNK